MMIDFFFSNSINDFDMKQEIDFFISMMMMIIIIDLSEISFSLFQMTDPL